MRGKGSQQGELFEVKPRCPNCGGPVVVVGRRAWCVETYANGGCGTDFARWSRPQPGGE